MAKGKGDEKFVFRLKNYRDKMGARVDPGRYRVMVDDLMNDVSSADNEMVVVWLKVLDKGEFEGFNIVDRLTQTEKTMFRSYNFLRACGLPTPTDRDVSFNYGQLRGRTLIVEVDDGEPFPPGSGRIKSEVRDYMPDPKAKAVGDEEDLDDIEVPDDPSGLDEYAEETTSNPGKGKKKGKKAKAEKPAPEPDDDDMLDDVDLDDVDL